MLRADSFIRHLVLSLATWNTPPSANRELLSIMFPPASARLAGVCDKHFRTFHVLPHFDPPAIYFYFCIQPNHEHPAVLRISLVPS